MSTSLNVRIDPGSTAGRALEAFLKGKRVLYGGTLDQVLTFWRTVTQALEEPLAAGVFHAYETEHVVVVKGTRQEIRATLHPDAFQDETTDVLILEPAHAANL
jgi:hypothetical protein